MKQRYRFYEVSDDNVTNVCGNCVFRKIEILPFAHKYTAVCCHPEMACQLEIVQTSMNDFDTLVHPDCPGQMRPKPEPKPLNILEHDPSELCFRGREDKIVALFDNGEGASESYRVTVVFSYKPAGVHTSQTVSIRGRFLEGEIGAYDVILKSEKGND